MKRALVLCLAGLLAACGSDDNGDGGSGAGSVTLTGPLGGNLASSTALSFTGQCTLAGISVSGAAVAVAFTTASVNACQFLQQNREPSNATTASVLVARFNTGGQAVSVTPGTYTVSSTPNLDGTLARVDVTRSDGPSSTAGEGCEDVGETESASGTVTITSATASRVAGSLDVALRDGGRLAGSFDVPTCALSTSIDPTTCEPTVSTAPTTCQ
jgi:hypothetical protein